MVLASSVVVDRTKEKKIGICCFSDRHRALKSRADWLVWNQDNVSE